MGKVFNRRRDGRTELHTARWRWSVRGEIGIEKYRNEFEVPVLDNSAADEGPRMTQATGFRLTSKYRNVKTFRTQMGRHVFR